MSYLADLQSWLRDNPPADIPFWPHAVQTAPFGLRRTQREIDIASPAHVARDRAGGGEFLMPFDGAIEWYLHDGVAGSVLREIPHGIDMEVQVFHTRARNGRHAISISERLSQGDGLPVRPSNLGLSIRSGGGDGTHTHTMVLLRHDRAIVDWIHTGATPIIHQGAVNVGAVARHCSKHHLRAPQVLEKLRAQIDSWCIDEMTDRYAVLDGVPPYRRPSWCQGPVVYVDSAWLLRI